LRQAKRISVSGPGDWGSAEDFAAAASNWRVGCLAGEFWQAINTTMLVVGRLTRISILADVTSMETPGDGILVAITVQLGVC